MIGGDSMTADELSREGEDPETCQLASRHQLQGPALTRSVTPPVVFCHLCFLGRDSKRWGQVMFTVREPHGRDQVIGVGKEGGVPKEVLFQTDNDRLMGRGVSCVRLITVSVVKSSRMPSGCYIRPCCVH